MRRKTLHEFIRANVKDETKAIYTAEPKSYLGIRDDDTRLEPANHSQDIWVIGNVQNTSIENVWSLFNRSIVGAFHKVSRKHMDRYLGEMEWHFNDYDNPHLFRVTMKRMLHTQPITYRELVEGRERKDA